MKLDEKEIIKKLISFKTVKGDYNNGLKDFIISFFKEIKKKEIATIPETAGRSFAIKLMPDKVLKKPIVFACHLDTVSPSQEWKSNPWSPVFKRDRITGLGAADMKGSIASILCALMGNRIDLKREIYLLFTSDEESTVEDIKKMSVVMKINNAVIIAPEPTGGKVTVGQKGVLELSVSMPGRSSHASNANCQTNERDNAIYKMARVIDFIKKQEGLFSDKEDTIFGVSTVNLGKITGGAAINSMAASCVLELSYRLSPRDNFKKIATDLTTEIKKIDCHAKIKVLFKGIAFDSYGKKEVKDFKKIVSRFFKNSKLDVAKFWSEAVELKGKNNLYLIFGPGDVYQAHSANEFIEIGKLKKFTVACRAIINEL